MKIALIGYAGSGKSSIGERLSTHLRLKFVEMDSEILKRSGRDSIVEIFDLDGEVSFRALETELCRELSALNDVVISTGGGVVTRAENIAHLKQNNGKIIYLRSEFETVCERLKGDTSRPLFRDKKKAQALYSERASLYLDYADEVVLTDEKDINNVVQEVLKVILKEKSYER